MLLFDAWSKSTGARIADRMLVILSPPLLYGLNVGNEVFCTNCPWTTVNAPRGKLAANPVVHIRSVIKSSTGARQIPSRVNSERGFERILYSASIVETSRGLRKTRHRYWLNAIPSAVFIHAQCIEANMFDAVVTYVWGILLSPCVP